MSSALSFDKKPADAPEAKLDDLITSGVARTPPRMLAYGNDGLGKSTFGGDAPDPVFICAEKGTGELSVARLFPQTWPELLGYVRKLIAAPKRYQTLVIDTLDWVESMIVQYVCKRDNGSNKRGVKHVLPDGRANPEAYDFGGVVKVLEEEWRILVPLLEQLQAKHGMIVVLLAHAAVSKEKNPEGNDYGVIGPSIMKGGRDYLIQWADAVVYVALKNQTVDASYGDERAKRSKMIATGERVMYTEPRGFRAKNRYSLPTQMPLSWRAFYKAFKANDPVVATDLKREIRRLLDASDNEAFADTYHAWLTGVGNNVAALRECLKIVQEATTNDAPTLLAAIEALVPRIADPAIVDKVRAWLAVPANTKDVASLRATLARVQSVATEEVSVEPAATTPADSTQ